MEKIYVLEPTYGHLNNIITNDATLTPFAGSDSISIFLTSESIKLDNKIFHFKMNINAQIIRDYLYTNVRWPIFSKRMTNIIDNFNLSYQKFPVIATTKDKLELEYYAFQISPISNILDLNNSMVTFNPDFPDFIFEVEKLVFSNAVEEAQQIFRIKEYPIKLFMRQALAINMIKNNLSGINIIAVDDYNWLLKG